MNNYYVYVVFHPDTGHPLYVGKGNRARWQHIFSKHCHNKWLKRIVAKANGAVPVAIIRDGLTNEYACEVEKTLIKAIGRFDLGEGPLVNFTDGGDGAWRRVLSQAEKDANSKRHRGKVVTPETRAKLSAALRGRKMGPETIKKRSASRRGKKATPAHLENARLGRAAMSPEAYAAMCEKIRRSALGRPVTEAARKKMSESRRGKNLGPRHPEVGMKIKAAKLGKKLSEAHVQALRDAWVKRKEKAKKAAECPDT